MATTYAEFSTGGSVALDYTPGADVSAGDVVVAGNSCLMAKRDIAANVPGSLHVGGVWKLPKSTAGGSGAAIGTSAYWDAAAHQVTPTASTNKKIGMYAATCLDGDAIAYVLSVPQS